MQIQDVLSDIKKDVIIRSIAHGFPYRIAAERVGVAYKTFNAWLKQGFSDMQEFKDTVYSRLAMDIREAEARLIEGCLDSLISSEAGPKWILERVFYKYYSGDAIINEFREKLDELSENKGE
jgi:hypothetical protein